MAIHGSVTVKRVDFSMLWQGAGLYDIHYGQCADMRVPFQGGNTSLLEMYNYSYVPENDWGMPANLDSHPVFPKILLAKLRNS